MIKPEQKPTGIGGLAFLFSVVALIAGIGLDAISDADSPFGVATQTGARAVIGVAVAVAVLMLIHGLRFVLRRPADGDGDAGNHA